MLATRVCSECGASLSGKPAQAKTCSEAHRSARSRRLRKERLDSQDQPRATQEIRDITRRTAPDAIRHIVQAEIRPIVREALTEDVLRAIDRLIGLTPRAVQALNEDLESEDPVVRQRAYTLLIKYTVGHPALVKPEDTEAGQQLVVNFNLPRPEEPVAADTDEAIELQECDMCHETKAADEFVAGSQRCATCFEDWRVKVMKEFTS